MLKVMELAIFAVALLSIYGLVVGIRTSRLPPQVPESDAGTGCAEVETAESAAPASAAPASNVESR